MNKWEKQWLYAFKEEYKKKSERELIELAKLEKQIIKEGNKIIYKENIEEYEKWMKIVSQVVKEVSLPHNSISYINVIVRLIHEGWISKNGSFQKENRNNLDIKGYLGIDVVNGVGCCRHTTSFTKNVLDHLKEKNEYYYCFFTKKDLSIREAYFQSANHVTTVFTYEGAYYIYDTLNREIYRFIDGLRAIPYYKKDAEKATLFFKIKRDMIYGNRSLEETEERIKLFASDSTKKHLPQKELKEIIKETNNRFDKREKDLEELKEQTRILSKKILPKKV